MLHYECVTSCALCDKDLSWLWVILIHYYTSKLPTNIFFIEGQNFPFKKILGKNQKSIMKLIIEKHLSNEIHILI